MKYDYMEVALTVHQLCRGVEALCDFLVDKRIVDRFEIDITPTIKDTKN